MSIPPAIDSRQFAADLEATVSEFNKLADLAAQLGLIIGAELHTEPMPDLGPARTILAIQVVSPV